MMKHRRAQTTKIEGSNPQNRVLKPQKNEIIKPFSKDFKALTSFIKWFNNLIFEVL